MDHHGRLRETGPRSPGHSPETAHLYGAGGSHRGYTRSSSQERVRIEHEWRQKYSEYTTLESLRKAGSGGEQIQERMDHLSSTISDLARQHENLPSSQRQGRESPTWPALYGARNSDSEPTSFPVMPQYTHRHQSQYNPDPVGSLAHTMDHFSLEEHQDNQPGPSSHSQPAGDNFYPAHSHYGGQKPENFALPSLPRSATEMSPWNVDPKVEQKHQRQLDTLQHELAKNSAIGRVYSERIQDYGSRIIKKETEKSGLAKSGESTRTVTREITMLHKELAEAQHKFTQIEQQKAKLRIKQAEAQAEMDRLIAYQDQT